MLNFSSEQKIKIFFTLYRITYAQKIFEYDFELKSGNNFYTTLQKNIYIYIKFRFQQLEYHYERKFFFKAMNFHSRINFHSILARNIHTHTVIVLTKVGQKRGERPVSYRVQN